MPVLVAGDPERAHEAQVADDGGIWYHNNLIDVLVSIGLIITPLPHSFSVVKHLLNRIS